MVDSVAVFPPGFRVLDSNGDPVNGAKIKFYETGPGDTKSVWSTAALDALLGPIVYTNSEGFPVASQGSSTEVMVYTDSDPYAFEITDADDNTIFPLQDDVRGALDTTDYLTSDDASTLLINVANVSDVTTLNAAYKGKLVNADPTSSTFTLTLDDATTLGDGWNCEIRHTGLVNYVRILATQNIYGPFGSRTAFSLQPGEAVTIRCDGSTFKIAGYVPPLIAATTGLILIADRISAAPSSPNPAARYICTAIFTSGGVTTAVGDIIEATGQGTFIKYTPPSNCGWLAYVQDEAVLYQYQSTAWAALSATQAQMQTATALSVYATPGNVRYHPGVAKMWGLITLSGTTASVTFSSNIASVTRNSVGNYTINFTTNFADTNYAVLGTFLTNTSLASTLFCTTRAVGSCTIITARSNTSADTTLVGVDFSFYLAAFGTSS